MHAAAYALDPKFIEVVKDLDAPCQTGLFQIFTKMAIRDVLLDEEWDISTPELLKVAVAKVNDRYPLLSSNALRNASASLRHTRSGSLPLTAKLLFTTHPTWSQLHGGISMVDTLLFCRPWRRESWRR